MLRITLTLHIQITATIFRWHFWEQREASKQIEFFFFKCVIVRMSVVCDVPLGHRDYLQRFYGPKSSSY